MPHHKSAEKRLRQTETRTAVNRARLSRVRTFVKKVETAIDSGDKLYLSNDDGGKWFNTGQTTPNGFTIFVHETDTNGSFGDHENAYVMVNNAAVANVQLVDAP